MGRVSLPGGLAPLGYRSYALFWSGFVVRNTGQLIELTSAVWLMYDLTGSAFALALLGLVRALPAFVLSPFAGVIAHRVDQRRLLAVTRWLGLAASAALALGIVLGAVGAWQVHVQVALQSATGTFEGVARQTFFPRLLPRSRV